MFTAFPGRMWTWDWYKEAKEITNLLRCTKLAETLLEKELKYLNHKLDLLYGFLLCRRTYLVTLLTGSMTMFLKTVLESETLSSNNVFPVILNAWKIQTQADIPIRRGGKLECTRKFQFQLLHFEASVLIHLSALCVTQLCQYH